MERKKKRKAVHRCRQPVGIYLAMLLFILPGGRLLAEEFAATCTFSKKTEVAIEPGARTVTAKLNRPGGAGLRHQNFSADGWVAAVVPSPDKTFFDAAIRIDLTPRPGYTLDVGEIEVHQASTGQTPVTVRTYCTRNGTRPDLEDSRQSSPETRLKPETGATRFSPAIGLIEPGGKSFASVYICATAPQGGSDWTVSKIIIRGTSQQTELPDNTVVVSSERMQQMRFGIDAERLWWWYPGIGRELARYAVGELQADYVRVAINCAYEREEGNRNARAYDRILDMMKALKKENPSIRFFASPRPLKEAYLPDERDRDFGESIPWSPYPLWVLPFEKSGTDGNGKSIWQMGELDQKKYTRYIADYLNLMHREGFSIEYLDVTNELNIPPEKVKYLVEHLNPLLDKEVKMPRIVGPSAWNMAQGLDWVKSADADILDVIACHNTDPGGSMDAFAEQGRREDKEIWNSELHDWWGVEPRDEILNSETLWKHVRAGFNGIDSWLFFGPIGGKDHTMIWTDGNEIRTSFKYEIYKHLVNHANRGYRLESTMPRNEVYTAAFLKDKTVTIWVLNKSDKPLDNLGFAVEGVPLNGQKIEITLWQVGTSNTGKEAKTTATKEFFTYTIKGESLYCFKMVTP